jgi:hypothetical protein
MAPRQKKKITMMMRGLSAGNLVGGTGRLIGRSLPVQLLELKTGVYFQILVGKQQDATGTARG